MKIVFLILILGCCFSKAPAQLEFSTGYAIVSGYPDGIPLQIGYDINVKNRFFTKSQIGYKHLSYYNDFVEATLKYSILEFHQTISYELIRKEKYILKPNVGLNYRFYSIHAEIHPPFNTIPQRAWILDIFRNQERIRLNSYDDDGTKNGERKQNNLGFSFQLQNKFRINNALWLHITAFIEPDYDRLNIVGGGYIGVIFKNLGKKKQ